MKVNSAFQKIIQGLLRVALMTRREQSIISLILERIPENGLKSEDGADFLDGTNSSLYLAITCGHSIEIIEAVLIKGAKVNIVVKPGYKPRTLLGLILDPPPSEDPLREDQRPEDPLPLEPNKKVLLIELLLKYGADSNNSGKNDETLLSHALATLLSVFDRRSGFGGAPEVPPRKVLYDNAVRVLENIQTLLLFGANITNIHGEGRYVRSPIDLIETYQDNIFPTLYPLVKGHVCSDIPNELKILAVHMLDRAKLAIKCRAAFDNAVASLKSDRPDFEKHLLDASQYDPALFKNLLHHLFTQQGQFATFDIKRNAHIKKLCALDVVYRHANVDVKNMLREISENEEKTYLESQQVTPERTQAITVDSEVIKDADKKTLRAHYEKLVALKSEELKAFSTLVKRAESAGENKKSAKINHWNSSFWRTMNQNNSDVERALSTLEQNSNRVVLSPYKPVMNNMRFFRSYVMSAIADTEDHNLHRVSYCLYFMQNMSVKYEEGKLTQPSVELLKNLYLLKGLLLAEVHAQSYLESLFNCAMTSRLSEHVEKEIKLVEDVLRVSQIDVDNDVELIAKRAGLASLNEAYGSTWRRFKTALLGDKENIHIGNEIESAREAALVNVGIKW